MAWVYISLLTLGICFIGRSSAECVVSCTLDEASVNLEPVLTKLDAVQTALTALTALTKQNIQDPKDCKEVLDRGGITSGVYRISPDGVTKINVTCEQGVDGGGWTVFQQRQDGSESFSRDWAEYKAGFGEITREFWLGNDNIHLLTKHHDQKLKIELRHHREVQYADYSQFFIANEDLKYQLYVSGFSGSNPPGDSLTAHHNQSRFSTKDRDNDGNSGHCAQTRTTGWWFNNCDTSNLNGVYDSQADNRGVNWDAWKRNNVSLTGARMMVKKRNC